LLCANGTDHPAETELLVGMRWFYACGKDEPDYSLEVKLVAAYADCILTG
jgi:hypothetical protein